MPIVQFEGLPKKRFAVAMEWRGLQGAGGAARKEASEVAKESQVAFGCVIEDQETGIAVVGLAQEAGFGVISGAAWLAISAPKEGLILVEKTIDGLFWICSVRGQMPMADGDMLVPFEEVSARVSACRMRSPDAKICSTVEGIEDVLGQVVGQSFAEIVSSAGVRPVAVRRLLGGERRLMVFVLAAGLLYGGYWLADDLYKKTKSRKNAAVLAQTRAQAKANEERQVTQLKAQRLAEAIRQMGEVVLNRPSVADSLQGTLNVVHSLSFNRAGWAPVKVDCGASYCNVSWKRQEFSTSRDFLESAQADGLQVVALQGDIATTYVELQAAPRQSTVEDLSPKGAFVVALHTNLQRLGSLGINFNVKGPDPIDKLVPKPVPPAGIKTIEFDPLPWSVGEVSVRGRQLFELADLASYIQHQGIAMKSAAINLETGQWETTFSYLAK